MCFSDVEPRRTDFDCVLITLIPSHIPNMLTLVIVAFLKTTGDAALALVYTVASGIWM